MNFLSANISLLHYIFMSMYSENDHISLKKRENSIETCVLSRVKQITSPGWMHETSAQA